MESRKKNATVGLTRLIADSLFRVDPKAKIIIMGEWNDDVKTGDLYNTRWKTLDKGIGSLAYANQQEIIFTINYIYH